MKISIITVSYNSAKTIEDTIKSVLGQDYKEIEYIIVDGGSTDGTLDIIKKYNVSKVISEKDEGIYDAMNKGIKMATGEVVGILNSDDFYVDRGVLSLVARSMDGKDCMWGDLVYVDKDNTDKIIRYWKSSSYEPGKFQKGWHPPHPTFFVKKHVYDEYGVFKLEFKIAADFELMLRFLEKNKITTIYIPKLLVKMRVGGKSNDSLITIIKNNIKCIQAFKANGLKAGPFFLISKFFTKISQYFH